MKTKQSDQVCRLFAEVLNKQAVQKQIDDLIDEMEPKLGQRFTAKERACLSRNIREKIREGMPANQAFAASVSICAPKKVRPKKPETTEKQSFTDKPWNGDKARFSDEQLQRSVPRAVLAWARSRAKTEGRDVIRADLKLPFKEPSGVINLGGVRAALAVLGGARGGVELSSEVKAAAKKELENALERGKAALSKSV